MAFELYAGQRHCIHTTPMARVCTDGKLDFNKAARDTLFPTEIKFVRLFFDRDKRQIGIERLPSSSDGAARPVCRTKSGEAYRSGLSMRSFFAYFGVDTKREKGSYPIVIKPDHALAMIQLSRKERP